MKIPSYDIIGEFAVIDAKNLSKKQERQAAKEIMKTHKRVVSVFKKASSREGMYRTRKLALVSGRNKSVAMHRESGCVFMLNIRKMYFSPREATERLRISQDINRLAPDAGMGMVFFSGIGPYPLIISKKCKVGKIIGIEMNPAAVKYSKKNEKLNKAANVETLEGDVRKIARKFYGKCDFVIMPLPETGHSFLAHAIKCLVPNGLCFFYAISEEKDLYRAWVKKIKSVAQRLGFSAVIIEKRRVLPYASRKWKVMICFRVKK